MTLNRRHFLLFCCMAWFLLGPVVCGEPARGEPAYLDIYNWEAFLAEDVLAEFSRTHEISVRQTYFDHESSRDAVITSGRAAAFDLILMDSVSLHILAEQDFFLDLSPLLDELGRDNFDPRWLEACGLYGVPYAYGAMGMLYRESVAVEPLRSWRQLFEPPPEHSGRIVMLEDEVDAPAAALLAIGAHPYSDDVTELRAALQLMEGQLDHLLAWEYGISYAGEHGAGSRMSLTLGFTGDEVAIQRMTGQTDWAYSQPEEGGVLWIDCFSVPAAGSLSQATGSFLKFINEPRIAARNAEAIGFASTSRYAMDHAGGEHRRLYVQDFSPELLVESGPAQRPSATGLRMRDRMMKSLLAKTRP